MAYSHEWLNNAYILGVCLGFLREKEENFEDQGKS